MLDLAIMRPGWTGLNNLERREAFNVRSRFISVMQGMPAIRLNSDCPRVAIMKAELVKKPDPQCSMFAR